MPRRASSTSFKPGQSGNPKGRPPKKRALTNLLERGGNVKIQTEQGEISAKKVMVARIWQGLATGQMTFGAETMKIDKIDDYITLVKLVLSQVDGPPKGEVDVTSAGEPIKAAASIDGMRDLFQMMGQREKNGSSSHETT